MESKKTLIVSAIKAGLVLTAISIVIFIIEYVANIQPVGITTPMVIMLVSLVVSVAVVVYFLKKYRTSVGGYISFGDAFLYVFIMLLTSGIVGGLFVLLFILFVEPNYYKNLMESQKHWMEGYMEGKMPQEQIDQALSKIDEKSASMTPVKQFFSGLLGSAVIGIIVGAIVGAIMKKKPDTFTDENKGGVI